MKFAKVVLVIILLGLSAALLWWSVRARMGTKAKTTDDAVAVEIDTRPKPEPVIVAEAPKAAPPVPWPSPASAATATQTSGQPVSIASFDPTTLTALKNMLADYKGAKDFQKIDESAIKLLKEWAAQDPQAVIAWLADIPDGEKNQEHALEGMVALEVETEPQVAVEMANAISNSEVRTNRLFDTVLALALKSPAAAAQSVQAANLPDEPTRAHMTDMIQRIQSGTLTEDQMAKITENVQKLAK